MGAECVDFSEDVRELSKDEWGDWLGVAEECIVGVEWGGSG